MGADEPPPTPQVSKEEMRAYKDFMLININHRPGRDTKGREGATTAPDTHHPGETR